MSFEAQKAGWFLESDTIPPTMPFDGKGSGCKLFPIPGSRVLGRASVRWALLVFAVQLVTLVLLMLHSPALLWWTLGSSLLFTACCGLAVVAATREHRPTVAAAPSGRLDEVLLHVVSHDLRNPLSCILAFSEMRREKCSAGQCGAEELVGTFSKIERAARQMESILDGLLEMQRNRGNGAARGTQPCLVWNALSEVETRFELQLQQKEQTLRVEMSDKLLKAAVDPLCLQQALDNYVANAIKFGPLGGEIMLRALERGDTVRIEVLDRGSGIVEWERNELFAEFGRTSSVPTGGERSTGLGLSIVRRLIELQHGRVGAEFPETGGSLFWVELPCAKSTTGSARPRDMILDILPRRHSRSHRAQA